MLSLNGMTNMLMMLRYDWSPKAYRKLSLSARLGARSSSSHRWKIRQSKDPYVEAAKEKNYRCRSAFKLLEMNQVFNLIRRGDLVLDVGAAPGAWSQVATQMIFSNLKEAEFVCGDRGVVAVDLLPVQPLKGVHVLSGCDVTDPQTKTAIAHLAGQKKFDLIISDMAPNASGIASLDAESLHLLNSQVFDCLVTEYLRKNGSCLFKFWQIPEVTDFSNRLKKHFRTVRVFKPKSSRVDSSELYVVAKSRIE